MTTKFNKETQSDRETDRQTDRQTESILRGSTDMRYIRREAGRVQ